MRILQISKYMYPYTGGTEQVARDVINSLKEHEQKAICFSSDKMSKTDKVDGVEIRRVGCQCKIASQSIAFGYKKELEFILRDFKPEVVIFHYPNPFVARYLLKLLKRFPKCKLVLYWHLDITKQKFLKLFFNKQNKRLLQRADKIVATSPNYIEGSKYLSAYKQKCVAIPNCVSQEKTITSEIAKTRSEEIRSSAQGKTICFAYGRHVPYKGMEYLVRASKLLSDEFIVYIAGSGPLTDSLKKLASGDKKVIFLGKISNDELIAHILSCDIFCFPSITKNEAFGIALAETMSYAKPCVTFNIPQSGVNYVSLNGVTGIEVENGNVSAYAEAIDKLAKNPALREEYGKNAMERERELFAFEKFSKNVNNLISEIEENK